MAFNQIDDVLMTRFGFGCRFVSLQPANFETNYASVTVLKSRTDLSITNVCFYQRFMMGFSNVRTFLDDGIEAGKNARLV